MLGIAPLGTLALSELPARYRLATTPPYALMLTDPDAYPIFLVKASPHDGADETTVYLTTSRGGYRTRPDDPDMPNAFFAPRLNKSFQINATLFGDVDPSKGSSNNGSEIEAINEGHDLDDWGDWSWDGRPVEVYAGLKGFRLSEFGLIAKWTGEGVTVDRQLASISMLDRGSIMSRQLQQTLYAGTGGKEGGPDLASTVKPLAFGIIRNAQPVPVDLTHLIYQLHDGHMQSVAALRDTGRPPADGYAGDYPTYEALVAATIPTFGWATCLAQGYVKLGSQPAGQVTCDFSGDATGGYVETVSTVLRRIVTTRLGDDNLVDPDEINATSFLAVETENSAPIGLYITQAMTRSDALNTLMASVYGYWYFDRVGNLAIGILSRPDSAAANITDKIIDQAGVTSLKLPPPPWQVKVAYSQVWLPQRDQFLAGAVSDADRAFWHDQYRYSTVENEAVKTAHKLSDTLTWNTLLDRKVDADALAAKILSFSSPALKRYAFKVLRPQLGIWLDKTILVQSADMNLSSGVVGTIVSIKEDYGERTVEIEVVV